MEAIRFLRALSLVVVAGCASQSSPASAPSATPSSTPDSSPTPDETPLPGSPHAASLAPDTGKVGTTIRIAGSDFGAVPGTVRIGAHEIAAASWSESEVSVVLPALVYPGPADVVVVAVDGETLPLRFEVRLPHAVYLNDDDGAGNSVSAYSASEEGWLSPLGPSIATGEPSASFGGDSGSAALHEGTRRLFVTNDSTVAVFDIDGETGALSPVAGSPFAVGAVQCYGVAVSADGARVFVGSYADSAVAVLNVSAAGQLSPVAGSPFALTFGSGPDLVRLSPDGRFLYANLENLQGVEVLSVAPDGALTGIAGSPFLYDPNGSPFVYAIRLDPTGTRLYAADSGESRILAYDLDPATGAPAAIPGSPFAVAGSVQTLSFDPTGAWLYALSAPAEADDEARIHLFSVDATGAPIAAPGNMFTSGLTDTSAMAVSGDGKLLFVVDEDSNRTAVYSIGPDGVPAVIPGSPFSGMGSGSPSGMAITR